MTHRGHLGPVVRGEDGGHYVAPEGWPGLDQEPPFLIYLQPRAVRCQPRPELCGGLGEERTAYGCGPAEDYLRPFGLCHLCKHACVGVVVELGEPFVVRPENPVCTPVYELPDGVLADGPEDHRRELLAEVVRQPPSCVQKLVGDPGDLPVALLSEDPHATVLRCVHPGPHNFLELEGSQGACLHAGTAEGALLLVYNGHLLHPYRPEGARIHTRPTSRALLLYHPEHDTPFYFKTLRLCLSISPCKKLLNLLRL